MNKLIISANLGRVRVLRHQAPGDDPLQQAHWIEAPEDDWKNPQFRLHERVTDQAGRFPQGAAVGRQTGMSYGEEHHLEDEIYRTALREVAEHIDHVLRQEDWPFWILAAPRSILPSLEKFLTHDARAHLLDRVGSDLTCCPVGEIQDRFPA